MADQLARGLFARFAATENPFNAPNDMEDNLRLIDDLIGLYTLQPPKAVGASLPASPENGAGQLFVDGTFAVFNAGAWRTYPPTRGVTATLADGTASYLCTGSGWDDTFQGSVGEAAGQAALATAARVAAESARDAALIQAGVYATEAAGRAAVADGVAFKVQGSGDVAAYEYRRVNSGSSTLIGIYPSSNAVQATKDELFGVVTGDKFVEASGGSVSPSVYQNYVFTSGLDYVYWADAKAGERTRLNLFCNAGVWLDATFDLAAGTVEAGAVGATMTRLADGWWRCMVAGTANASAAGNLQLRTFAASGGHPYAGDGASGLYVNEAGLRVGGGPNLLTNPAAFGGGSWSRNGCTVSADVARFGGALARVIALEALPSAKVINDRVFGALTGDKFVEASGGSVAPSVYRNLAATSGTTYTYWAQAKAGTRSRLNLFNNTGAPIDATFDLVNGTASGTGAAISYLGDGWWLCEVTVTAGATSNGNFQLRTYPATGGHPYAGNGSSGLYVNDAGIRIGSTELLAASSAFGGSSWLKSNCTVLADVALFANLQGRVTTAEERLQSALGSIDLLAGKVSGKASADKFVEASGASKSPSVYQYCAPLSAAAHTIWADAKAGERSRLNLYYGAGGVLFEGTFDLTLATASGTGAAIKALGAGWYRCSVTRTTVSTAGGNFQLRTFPASGGHPYAGDGASGLYVNEAGLNLGASPNPLANLLAAPSGFAGASWLLQECTVSQDAALFWSVLSRLDALEAGNGSAFPAGFKVAAIGTSITEQDAYTSRLAAKLGLALTNLGTSGGSIGANAHYGSLYIYNAIASIPVDSQLVTIEAGINDFGAGNTPLGALGNTSTATFYGALYAAVLAIRTRAPNAKIVFFTPYSGGAGTATHRHGVTNTNGNTLVQFQRAVEEVAKYTGYPVIDVGQGAGIGYHTAAALMGDDLHINAAGGTVYADFVADGMLKLRAAGFI